LSQGKSNIISEKKYLPKNDIYIYKGKNRNLPESKKECK